MTVGEGLDNIGDKMGGILETLNVITHPNKSGHSTLPDKHTPTIKVIQQNELFTEDNFTDLWFLLIDKYEIGSIYLAIKNLEQCICYVAFPYHFSILLLSLNHHHLTDYLTYHLTCAPDLVPYDWGAHACSHNPITDHLILTLDFSCDQACDSAYHIWLN